MAIKKELIDRIIQRVQASRPKDDAEGTFEMARTTKKILTRINYVLMSGIEPFDREVGGFPFGRLTEIYGPEYCGKTALAKLAGIRAQMGYIYERLFDKNFQFCGYKLVEDCDINVVYLDNESSIDQDTKIWFTDQNGKKTQIDWALGFCDTIDQMFKILDKSIETMREYEAELRKEGKFRKQFLVFVVDTIAGTSSASELKAEWGKEDYPRQAMQLRRGFRRMMRQISQGDVCVIATNQVSDNFQKGNQKGPVSFLPQERDFSSFGGRALKFWASLRLWMFAYPATYVLKKGAESAAGILVGFYTKKNRMIKPLREGRMSLVFDHELGLHPELSILETLIYFDFAFVGTSGDITLRLLKHDIPFTTIALPEPKKGKKQADAKPVDPVLSCRGSWPEFYSLHRPECDALWEKCVTHAFMTEGLGISPDAQLTDPDADQIDSLLAPQAGEMADLLGLPALPGVPE